MSFQAHKLLVLATKFDKDARASLRKFAEEGRQLWDKTSRQWVAFPSDLGGLFKIPQGAVSRVQHNGQWAYHLKDNDKWHPLAEDRLEYYIDQTPATNSIPEVTITGNTPGKGSGGVAFDPKVKQVQIALNKLKLPGADGKPLAEDGKLGKNTKFAIESFKTEYNMPGATDALAMYYILNPSENPNQPRYATPSNQPTKNQQVAQPATPPAPATTASRFNNLIKKYAGVTIQFRPGEVKDMVQTALEMSGGKYEYSPEGSRVGFTGKQFNDFVGTLKAALDDQELFDDAEKTQIQETLNHIMSQLPSA